MKQLVLILFIGVVIVGFNSSKPIKFKPQQIDKEALLERHNYYRDKVGSPHLEWSYELEKVAQEWADHLAERCKLEHSNSNYGENIYWSSVPGDTEFEVVDDWASEEKYFNHKNPIYKKGMGMKYGHYTQIIWSETTHMGGAKQICPNGGEIWVCIYDPIGNWVGERVYK